MDKKLRWAKYVGRLLTLFAIVFIGIKMISYDLDYKQLLHPKLIITLSVCMGAYALSVLTNTIPWLAIVEIISGQKIPLAMAVFVNVRANMLKYLPGNIFQYIGKNELAVKCNINHFHVAISTMLDVLLMLVIALGVGLLCFRQYFWLIFGKYVSSDYAWIIFGICFLLFLVIGLYICKKQSNSLIKKMQSFFEKKNRKKLIVGVLYYILQNFYIGAVYVIILLALSQKSIKEIPIGLIIGSNILSGVMGFVTPGAPGGIGIREMAMVYITQGQFEESIIVLTSVIYRFLTIVGDVVAFLMVCLYLKIKGKRTDINEIQGER